MKERILQFLALENLSPTRFADQLGVQRSGVSHILAGRNKPSYDFIEKMLLTFPNISAEWLLLGKGEMSKAATVAAPQMLSLFEERPLEKKIAASAAPPNGKTEGEQSSMENEEVKKFTDLQHITAQTTEKMVETITIFYTDKTFCTYRPD
ncbi:MAG: helix-turn-helix domain-containing protein [Prevotellaceae bacterium]|jgi:transcriptional regulator with XRE-family HTH domain|nr:helix-turn-helix domain-containing protein [Prevotellaceae bacterium]